MQRPRPTAVTVIAILNFIFGGLGVIALLCISVLGIVVIQGSGKMGPRGGPDPIQDMLSAGRQVPGLGLYLVASIMLGLVLSVVLIASGVGLLKLQPWGRHATIFCSVANLLLTIGSVVYGVTTVNPVEAQLQAQAAITAPRGMPPSIPGSMRDPFTICFTFLGGLYYVVLLVYMHQPHVREAFEDRTSWPVDDSSRYDDRPPLPEFPRGGGRGA